MHIEELPNLIATLQHSDEAIATLKDENERLVAEKEHNESIQQQELKEAEATGLSDNNLTAEKNQELLLCSRSSATPQLEHVEDLTNKISSLERTNRALMDKLQSIEDDKEVKQSIMEQPQRSSIAIVSTDLERKDTFDASTVGAENRQEVQGSQYYQRELEEARSLNTDLTAQVHELLHQSQICTLEKTESRLQQDRQLLSCISTELYDSTFRESQLREELAGCYKKLELISKQVGGVVQNDMQYDTDEAFHTIKAVLDGKEEGTCLEERHGSEDQITELLAQTERRLMAMELTPIVEPGAPIAEEKEQMVDRQATRKAHSQAQWNSMVMGSTHLAESNARNVALEQEIDELKGKLAAAEKQQEIQNTMPTTIDQPELDDARLLNEKLKADVEDLQKNNNYNALVEGQLEKAQTAIVDLASKTKALRQALLNDQDEANEREIRMTKEVMTQRAQAHAVQVKLKERDYEYEELEEDLEAIRQEAQTMIEDLRAQVEALKSKNDEVMAERDTLQRERESLETSRVEQTHSVE